nr:hypothetical protein [Armatimonadota bacterium]NIM23384.1 hypothetical protein [Armatimonadota bacterium]NIM67248.1 hypothetical protein [Armatimonadota bacterium]NIM75747.1 hypothetical protein [Armatimonadota bacterium]NIN05435.1 hypothetical protein [Armatimonadota bacterium]
MPQTEEHLDVLCSLNLSAGVVALTKADKASPERIREVSADVTRLLKGNFLGEGKGPSGFFADRRRSGQTS